MFQTNTELIINKLDALLEELGLTKESFDGSVKDYRLSGAYRKLFVKPNYLSDMSIFKLRWYLCKFVRMADPGSFPRVHDLRKVATSLAFLRHVNLEEICSLTGWSSIRVFRRHYFKEIESVKSSLVAMGSVVPGSVRDV